MHKRGKKILTQEKIELKSSDLALTPLMLAERDREHLKQCRRNRDAEAELIKGVEGWTVGTYYGMPIYQTVKKRRVGATISRRVLRSLFARGAREVCRPYTGSQV